MNLTTGNWVYMGLIFGSFVGMLYDYWIQFFIFTDVLLFFMILDIIQRCNLNHMGSKTNSIKREVKKK